MASIMDPDHFMKALLHKYNLRNWSKGNGPKNADDKDSDKEATEKESVVAREFLLLLFHVLSERYVSGIFSGLKGCQPTNNKCFIHDFEIS